MSHREKARDVLDNGQKISRDWFNDAIRKDIPHIMKGKKIALPSERHNEQKEKK